MTINICMQINPKIHIELKKRYTNYGLKLLIYGFFNILACQRGFTLNHFLNYLYPKL